MVSQLFGWRDDRDMGGGLKMERDALVSKV